jgi:hypothetical protein
MPQIDDEVSYKHSIIQFSQVLLDKYVLRNKDKYPTELAVYGYLFARLIHPDKRAIEGLINYEKTGGDLLIQEVTTALVRNKDGALSNSFRTAVSDYLFKKYQGSIDNSRAKSLLGDLFLLSLIDCSYALRDENDKVLTTSLLHSIREGKDQDFVKAFLDIFLGNVNKMNLGDLLKYPELTSYYKMILAFIQYQEYINFMKNGSTSDGLNARKEVEFLEQHLHFVKEISADMYNSLEIDGLSLKFSDNYIIRYLYISTFLIRTEYDNSISLNRLFSSNFMELKLKESKPFLKLVKERVKYEIDPQISSSPSTWIFNPFRFLKEQLGIFGSWVLWAILLFVLVVASNYYMQLLTKFNISLTLGPITLEPILIPYFLGVLLLITLVSLLFYLIKIRKKLKY